MFLGAERMPKRRRAGERPLERSANITARPGGEVAALKGKANRKGLGPLLILVILYLLFYLAQTGYKLFLLGHQLGGYELRRAELLKETKALQEEYGRLQDKAYLERQAREQLGLIRPGEKVLVPAQPGQVVPHSPVMETNKIAD